MIKQIEISNFRNIKQIVLNFNEKCSILTGANGIGKSNTLNAASYVLTNTLLTDKWGYGENELKSIFPKDYVKGQEPCVSITLESGITFTKKFVKGAGKNGNSTEFYINGVKEKNTKDFEESLYKNFKYTPKLKCEKEVDELRLNIDPLYPLQKLDAKALRTLLVELGCSVTNEEVFALHKEFEKLKEYEEKYQGDYTKMRTSFKEDRKELVKQLDAIPELLDSYAGEDFNPDIRKGLEKEKEEIITKINALKNDSNSVVDGYKKELSEIKHQKELYVASESSKIMTELAKLNEQKSAAENDVNNSQNEELKSINSKIQSKSEELLALNQSKQSYSITRANCRNEAIAAKETVDELINRKLELESSIETISKREFKGYVTCPDCGKMFIADETALVLFNKQKQDDIENAKSSISNIEIDIKKKEKIFNEVYHKGYEAKVEEEKIEKRIFYLKDEIDTLNVQKTNIAEKPIDRSKVEEIEAKIKAIKETKIDTSKYNSKIEKLEETINQISNNKLEANQDEIVRLSSFKEDIESKIKVQYELEIKQNARNDVHKKQVEITKQLNDSEHLIALVNGFIQTKIKYINNKAKKLTGIDFVMLEENLTNDGVKEVCYATVDGVEFGNVNTSKKLEVGIQFIHKIREILGANDLPILADRLEGFDDIQKIKNLTTEQMICTVVGNSEQKEIVVI